MTYLTDEELRRYTASGVCTTGCEACLIAHELLARRPNSQERSQLADALVELSDFPAAQQYIVRQLERGK